jgi:hypothetical protein
MPARGKFESHGEEISTANRLPEALAPGRDSGIDPAIAYAMNKTGRIGKGPTHLAVTAQLASAVTEVESEVTD